MKDQEFLKKLITRKEKQVNFLKKFANLTHSIKGYEEEIILAQINYLENKKKM